MTISLLAASQPSKRNHPQQDQEVHREFLSWVALSW